MRDHGNAGGTPGGPEFEEDDFTFEFVEFEWLGIDPVGEHQRRRGLALHFIEGCSLLVFFEAWFVGAIGGCNGKKNENAEGDDP